MTFTIDDSDIVDSEKGGAIMSSIDLVILGIVLEKPQSAYDIQKDVEYHHFSRWTKISVPSIYRKVLQLCEKGYLQSDIVKGNRNADKAIYSVTANGKKYFEKLMALYIAEPIPLQFDFNVVISNLNKMEKKDSLHLLDRLKENIAASLQNLENYETEYIGIPLGGKTIFEQQRFLYQALLEWIDNFISQYKES